MVEVPQAQYHQRPVFLNGNPMKGSYKRNHEGDYHATAEDVKAMLRDANDAGNDGTLLEGYGMDDIDPETLRAYRMEYELRNPDHSLLGFTLIMTLVGGSFITFVANFFRRWWLIIQFGLDKQDIGWILGCIAFGGIVAMVWEGVMAIIKTFKTLFMDTFYLHNHKDEVIEPQYPSQYED